MSWSILPVENLSPLEMKSKADNEMLENLVRKPANKKTRRTLIEFSIHHTAVSVGGLLKSKNGPIGGAHASGAILLKYERSCGGCRKRSKQQKVTLMVA
jgi:hypothetical protein